MGFLAITFGAVMGYALVIAFDLITKIRKGRYYDPKTNAVLRNLFSKRI